MNSYLKLSIVSILLCFTGCATTDSTINNPNSLDESTTQLEVAQTKNKSIKAKLIKNKPYKQNSSKIEPKKPQEVERVCFDKQGQAHNCNYKIPKPY